MKVLVIDDEIMISKALSRALERREHFSKYCLTGEEGLALLKSEAWDAVFLDIMLPDMSGIKILEELKQTNSIPEEKVIIISAFSDSQLRGKIKEIGNFKFIRKPFKDIFTPINKIEETPNL